MSADRATLLAAVRAQVPMLHSQAAALDNAAEFPHAAFAALAEHGLLRATLPAELGGYGFGIGPEGAADLCRLLMLVAEGSLAVARLFEAHVNALQLVCRYATPALIRQCANDAIAGHLFALWVTDPLAGEGVSLHQARDGFTLAGAKEFCSGAGVATRALITAQTPAGAQMLIVQLAPGARALPSRIRLSGMRAAITGSMDFTGMAVSAGMLLGATGDYLREPVFSAGAWRGSAAAAGALAALARLHGDEISQRGRSGEPLQRARYGAMVMNLETARLWAFQAAQRACLEDRPPDEIVAYVNLARLAVEAACLAALQLTQRSLGLSSFLAGRRVEILCRDLATYLRQPAPDETMDRAAAYYFSAPLPG